MNRLILVSLLSISGFASAEQTGTASNPDKPGPAASAPVRIPNLYEARKQAASPMDRQRSLQTLTEALSATKDPVIQQSLLRGMLLGLDGEREIKPPPGWRNFFATVETSSHAEVKKLANQLSAIFGDDDATKQDLATLQEISAPIEERRRALNALITQRKMEVLPLLPVLLKEDEIRPDAIRAYRTFFSPDAPKLLLNLFPKFTATDQRIVIETLASRKEYAESLFAALESGTVSERNLPAYVSRTMGSLLGERFTSKYGIEKLSTDKEAQIAKYLKLATSEASAKADPGRGRLVYQKACMACHHLYEEGGEVGPDLTGSNRADLNYLLLNILDPSGDIPDAYKMVLITTKDGQVLAGSIKEEDDRKVVLSTVGQQVTVVKNDIQSRETSPVSMMPEGLLQTLTEPEILDLFAYMKTKEQVAIPK